MEITDKDRLDFLEKYKIPVTLSPVNIKNKCHFWYCVPGYNSNPNIRDAIDNAIMAMREKDK